MKTAVRRRRDIPGLRQKLAAFADQVAGRERTAENERERAIAAAYGRAVDSYQRTH